MDSRPTPCGFQHAIELPLRCTPESRFTDPIRALGDMEGGLIQPVVEVLEEHEGGSALGRVSVFGDNRERSPKEVAALKGLVAELRFADALGP